MDAPVNRAMALALAVVVAVAGYALPPRVLGDGFETLPESERAFAEQARAEVGMLVWENPFERLAHTHTKVVDVVAVDAEAPRCHEPGLTLEPCLPEGADPNDCAGDGDGRWRTAHLRAYTWGGIPVSDALVSCTGASRI